MAKGDHRSFVLNEILDALKENEAGLKRFSEVYIKYFLERGSNDDFANFIHKLEKYPSALTSILTYQQGYTFENESVGVATLLQIAVDRNEAEKVSVLAPHYSRDDRRGLINSSTSFAMVSALKKQTVVRVVTSAAMQSCYNGVAAVVMSPMALATWAMGSGRSDRER